MGEHLKPATAAVRDLLRYRGPTCGVVIATTLHQFRYSARLHELRDAGYSIRKTVCTDPSHAHRARNYVYELVEERTWRYWGIDSESILCNALPDRQRMDSVAKIENNIRRLRQVNGHTLEDLAAEIGVSPSTIAKWEVGSRECPDEFKIRIARFYGWPVHAVFLFDTDSTPASLALRALIDKLDKRIASPRQPEAVLS